MPMQYAPDPEIPGSWMVTDSDTGLTRRVYDPARMGASQPEPLVLPTPEAPAPLAPQEHLRAEGPPLPPAMPAPGLPPAPNPEQWGAAQTPKSVIPRASGGVPPMPDLPSIPGVGVNKVKITPGTPGSTYDKAAEEARGEDLLDRNLELQRRQEAADLILGDQQLEAEKMKAEAEKREAINQEKTARYERQLETVVKREINNDRIKENQPVFGSILGIVGQALGALSSPGSGGRWVADGMQRDLDNRITRDIASQREQKESSINLLTKQLGNAQQAEDHYRAQVSNYSADILESRLKRLGLDNQYADQIQSLRDTAAAYNDSAKAASFGQPGKIESIELNRNPIPKATGTGAVKQATAWDEELQSWNISNDDYDRGLATKTESGLTVGQETNAIKSLDSDRNVIASLMAVNGGDLQGQELIQIPQPISNALAAMGVTSAMKREEANQMIQKHMLSQATSYGTGLTPAQIAEARASLGTTEAGYLRFIAQQREAHNKAFRTGVAQYFKKNGQRVAEKLLRDTAATTGVPDVAPKPFENKNAPSVPLKPVAPSQPNTGAHGRTVENILGFEDAELDAAERKRKRKSEVDAAGQEAARRYFMGR